uniref:RRP15-like protein n=1 Tax=Lotus japonicus TaxID=34305 RepID=I3S676_LOTJA|nr:unknown [Lotus japonicus]
MADETQLMEPGRDPRKRKFVKNQRHKNSKLRPKGKPAQHGQEKVKVNQEMKKLYHKRAREYNSDDDEEDETAAPATTRPRRMTSIKYEKNEVDDIENEDLSDDEGAAGGEKVKNKNVTFMKNHNYEGEEEDDGEILPGITKFTEGCKAFKLAFMSIVKKSVSDDLLNPILSANKNLVVEKLAEEVAERKGKREARKEKQMLAEKGHVKPATYLDTHEKFLISVATKGVVKLFNAVNKAQVAQKGFNPSRIKDAKELRKRTKEAFFSELGKPSLPGTSGKVNGSTSNAEDEQPAWAPLQDNYMLTSSKLKDWDKMPNKNVSDDTGKISEDSSDED